MGAMEAGSSASQQAFPSTLWSEVLAFKGDPEDRRERLERLILRYWRPVHRAVCAHAGVKSEEAPDLTQEFFVQILEGGILPGVDPELGSFRNYLNGALRNFLLKDFRRGNTDKRGGGRRKLSLDFDSEKFLPAASGTDPAEVLDKAWARELLDEAVADLEVELRGEGRSIDFDVFKSYDLAGAADARSYSALAGQYGLEELDVWRMLRSCRTRLRRLILARIGPYVRDEAEVVREFQELFRF